MSSPDIITWPEVGVIVTGIVGAMTAWKLRKDDKQHYDDRLAQNEKDLADFKLYVANNHPVDHELTSLRADVMSAINRLTERIDRWLERTTG